MYDTGALRTVIGPLTTTFTPAPACTIALRYEDRRNNMAWLAQTCTTEYQGQTGDYIADGSSCWPQATFGVTASPPFLGWGFYSPGAICPVGHTTACSATGGGSWGWPVQYSVFDGETAYGCCPSGFACNTKNDGSGQTCIGTVTAGEGLALAACSSGSTVDSIFVTPPVTVFPTVSGSVSAETFSSYVVYAPMIEIRRQASDHFASSTSASTPTSTSTGATSTVTAFSGSSSGLSTGAKVAIGVCIPVFVLALLVGAFFLWRRRRTPNRPSRDIPYSPVRENKDEFPRPPTPGIAKSAPAIEPYTATRLAAPKDAADLHKKPVDRPGEVRYAEMAGSSEPQEMDGGYVPYREGRHELAGAGSE